jgi:hypothetical protein
MDEHRFWQGFWIAMVFGTLLWLRLCQTVVELPPVPSTVTIIQLPPPGPSPTPSPSPVDDDWWLPYD